jgi:filamentous hemagglutinin family protein
MHQHTLRVFSKGRAMLVARIFMLHAIILGPVPVAYADPAAGALPVATVTPPVNATVNTVANTMTVTQTGATAELEWASFDIGSAATVNFVQNVTDVAINKITDLNPSEIFGALNADGTVYLLNPNGFVFGAGSTLNAAGLVATTAEQIDTLTLALSSFGDGTIIDLAGIDNANPAGTIALLAKNASAEIAADGTATLTAAQTNFLSGQKVELANIAGGTFTIQLDTTNVGDKNVASATVGLDVAVPVDATFTVPLTAVEVLGDANGASIQDAVDIAAAGGTVTVAAGTYNEDLVINKGLTLQSADTGTATINLQDGVGIDIQADSVTLGGAANQGFDILGGATTTFAIQLPNNPDSVNISHNAISTVGSASQGISVGAAGASGLTIGTNTFLAEDGDGAIWAPGLVDAAITDNVFNTVGNAQQATGYAIEVAGVTGTSAITGNQVNNYANGIFLLDDAGVTGLTLTGNTMANCLNGLRTYTGYGAASGTIVATVTGNTFTGNTRQVNDGGGVLGDFGTLAGLNTLPGAWAAGGSIIYSALQGALGDGTDISVAAGTYGDDFTLDADTTITGVGGAATFTGTTTIDGGVSVTMGSALSFAEFAATNLTDELTLELGGNNVAVGGVGTAPAPFEAFTVNGTGQFQIGGDVYTDGNTQTYNSPFVLTGNVSLADATGGITFNDTVDGPYGLTINAGTAVSFGGVVGSTPLTSLTAVAGTSIELKASVTTAGNQDYDATGGAITMSDGVVANATAGTVAMTATGDIALGGILTTNGTADAVKIDAGGEVLDAGDTDTDIVADSANAVVTIDAVSGIGDGNALETQVASLDASVSGTGDVAIAEANAIDLADVDTADGTVTVAAAGQITATDVDTSATDDGTNTIDLTATVDGIQAVSINAGAQNDVALDAATAITEDGVADTDDVVADQLTADAATGIKLGTTVTSLDASVSGAGDVDIAEANAIDLADVDTADGALFLTTGGAITQSAPAVVGGATTLTAAGNDITLDNVANVFGDLTLTGGVVSITESDAITDGGAWTTGATTLNAGANDIALDNSANVFGDLTITGGTVAITEGAAITDGGAWATGVTTLVADDGTRGRFDITLNAPGSTTGALRLTGANVAVDGYAVTDVSGAPDTVAAVRVDATGNASLANMDFTIDNGDRYVQIEASANDPIAALLATWASSTFSHGVVLTNEMPILYSTIVPAFDAATAADSLADLEVWIEGRDYGNEVGVLNGDWDTIAFHGMTAGVEDGSAGVSFQTLRFGADTTANVYATGTTANPTLGLQLSLENLLVLNLNRPGQLMQFDGRGRLANDVSQQIYLGQATIQGYVYWGGDQRVGRGDRIGNLAFTDAARPDYFPTDSHFLTRFLSNDGSAGTGLYSIDFVDYGNAKVSVDNRGNWPVTVNPDRLIDGFAKEFQAFQ